MNTTRKILLAVILGFAVFLLVIFSKGIYKLPMDATLSPAFTLLGKQFGYTNHALTKLLPVNDMDEKEYGDAIRMRYEGMESSENGKKINHLYINSILKNLSRHKKKDFAYTAYIIDEAYMNAFALPGGVIFITSGMLDSLHTEAELAGVIAHEIGHIELSHCLDAVRMQLLAEKTGMKPLGELADFMVNTMFRHTYSKAQEDASDEYAYKMLLETSYNPGGVGAAFDVLAGDSAMPSRSGIITEYFMSHPHTSLRADKFRQKADNWWKHNEDERRYNGKRNLQERTSFFKQQFDEEWISQ